MYSLVKIEHWVVSGYGPFLNSALNFALIERHMGVFCLLCVFGASINCVDKHKVMVDLSTKERGQNPVNVVYGNMDVP